MRHEITQDEMEKFRHEHRVRAASSTGDGLSKFLDMTLDGKHYIVVANGEEVYRGDALWNAIEHYNAAQ